jgi:hypothetical protein
MVIPKNRISITLNRVAPFYLPHRKAVKAYRREQGVRQALVFDRR